MNTQIKMEVFSSRFEGQSCYPNNWCWVTLNIIGAKVSNSDAIKINSCVKKKIAKKNLGSKKTLKAFFFKYSFKRDYKLTVAYIGKVVTDVIEVQKYFSNEFLYSTNPYSHIY